MVMKTKIKLNRNQARKLKKAQKRGLETLNGLNMNGFGKKGKPLDF